MEAVFKREFRSLFTSVTGWIYLTVLFIMCGIFTMANSLIGHSSQFEYVLSSMPLFLLVAVPVLCMRSLSGEKRARTDQLLYSLPIRMSQVVTGKYLALAAVHAIACLGMGFVPVILSFFGKVPLCRFPCHASSRGRPENTFFCPLYSLSDPHSESPSVRSRRRFSACPASGSPPYVTQQSFCV